MSDTQLTPQPVRIGDHFYWFVNGRLRPHVAGGSDAGSTPPPDLQPATTNTGVSNTGNVGITPGYGGGGGGGMASGTVTVTPPVDEKKIAAAAKKQAAADVAAELGCTVEEAKQILGQVKAAGEAQKSDAQRLHDQAVATKAEADQILAAAAADRLALKVERKLLAAGVAESGLERAARMLGIPPEADDEAIAAEIDVVRGLFPSLFGTAVAPGQSAPPAPAPGVTPPRPPGTTGGGESEYEAGQRLARERFPNLQPATRSS